MQALAALLPASHGQPEPLFHGDVMAGAKVRDIQVRIDIESSEVVCVRWRGLEREVLLEISLKDAGAKSRVQALFDEHYPPPPAALEV